MKSWLLVALFALASINVLAQKGEIYGQVIDAKTQTFLPFVNVYVNKTTIGTITNDSGKFVLKNLPRGSAEIAFSSIGYGSYQLNVLIGEGSNKQLSIKLVPDVQQLSEVEVRSGRDKVWEKQLKKFEKIFLGTTSSCKILNPWVIDFADEKNMLTANASIPIEIENTLLGYKLFFQLKNFAYSSTEFSIVGNSRFSELTTSNAGEALKWMKNRERAYLGSIKHLMKSILDHNINKNGFSLYREKAKGKLRSHNFGLELQNNLSPYDTSGLVEPDSVINEYRIKFKEKVEVHYFLDFSQTNYYTDINNPVSWLEVSGGYVWVNQAGTILNPKDIAISGEMSDARVSNMLPSDYKPGNIIAIESPKNISAKRLQEKVYLHTDKPYYYPGDKIWFSAYMNYRAPGLMDTLSKVLYVDLINRDRVTTENLILKIDSGRAAGSFNLPAKISPGSYVLRAYTQWMRNYGIDQFFYKPINVLSVADGVEATPFNPVTDHLLKITFDKSEYKKRDKVKMTLSLNAEDQDEKIKGSFSVSVLDDSQSVYVKEPQTIKNDFQLIEPSKEMMPTFKYPIERGVTFDGIYKDKNGKRKKTKLTILPETLESIYQVPTLNNGEFSLKDLTFYDSAKFGIQPVEGKVILKNKELPALPEKLSVFELPLTRLSTSYKASSDTLKTILLKEIEVHEKKIKQYENSYAEPDSYIKSESIETYQNLGAAIAAKIPAFKLFYYETHWYLIWARGEFTRVNAPSEPVLYIDQALVVGETAGDRLVYINPATIDHIEVKGMIGSNLGANGANGMISVFTKRFTDPAFKGLPIIKIRGFDHPRIFEAPNYDNPQTNLNTEDYRSTLFWDPRVSLTSTHSPVDLSFFTSDQSGNYRVIVEGVTNKGNTIHAEAILKVSEY